MKQATLSVPEIGIIAATRGIAGAGIGLLLADKIAQKKRMSIGRGLLVLGALSTIPLVIDVIKKCKD